MTRKDIILISVIINAGLLAVLFTTAMVYDGDQIIEQNNITPAIVESKPDQEESKTNLIASASSMDEVDHVLKYYHTPPSQEIQQNEPVGNESLTGYHSKSDQDEEAIATNKIPTSPTNDTFVEVTVKKGDVLEKIAKNNGTTISAIKKHNRLVNEKLSIGQVLRIPTSSSVNSQQQIKTIAKADDVTAEPVFHVVKAGDSPWKIAKQYNVKYEDILRLNHLDEDKAKNLKIGDRIRVK